MDDSGVSAGLRYIEGYCALNTAQIVVESGCGINEKGGGNALEIQGGTKIILKYSLYITDSGLRFVKRECGFVAYPEDVVLKEWELDSLIETYENIKNKLEHELEAL